MGTFFCGSWKKTAKSTKIRTRKNLVPHGSNLQLGWYRKIPIIRPGLVFLQEAYLLGLFSGQLIFGGFYYWNEFCISKWVALDNKNSLKH